MPKLSDLKFDKDTARKNEPRPSRYELREGDRSSEGITSLILRIEPTGRKTWRVELAKNIKRNVGNANVMTLGQARTKATLMRNDYSNGKEIASKRSAAPTLKKFLDGKYRNYAEANNKSGKADVARLLSACDPMLETRLNKLNEFQIEKWKAGRLKDVTPATVHRDLATLRAALSLAVKWGVITSNPAGTGRDGVKVKVPKHKRVRYLSDKERKALLDALANRDKEKAKARERGNRHRMERGQEPLPAITGYADYLTPLVLLVMNTGLRRGEALSLTWENVKLGQQPQITVTANFAKSSSTRHIPLNKEAVSVLKRWKGKKDATGWVFPHPVSGHRMRKLKTSWPALMKKTKVVDFRFHDLRHDFASRLVMAGVDLYRVRDLLGHSSIQMTERYAHLAPKALADAVEVLA